MCDYFYYYNLRQKFSFLKYTRFYARLFRVQKFTQNAHREISLISNRPLRSDFFFYFFSFLFLSSLFFFFIPRHARNSLSIKISSCGRGEIKGQQKQGGTRKGTRASDHVKIEVRSCKGDGIKTDVMFNPLLSSSLLHYSSTRFFFFTLASKDI